jgi:bacterioferritin-associated ferredoxin
MRNEALATGSRQPAEADARDDMVCPCAELRQADLRRILAARPNLSFDELLAQTGAGGKCTACLLDLEYFYTTLPRDRSRAAATAADARRVGEAVSLKQRVYRLVDRLSPWTPMPLTEYMPVLCAKGIAQWVCIANHSMLYEPGACAPDTDFKLLVRDAAGREIHREVRSVAAGGAERILVSSYLEPKGELGIGSVQVSRRARRPGVRGTTRPQIEIVAAAGACAVHTQAPGRLRNRWVSVYHRPGDERVFASVVNASAKPLAVEIAYPFVAGGGIDPVEHTLSVAPFGALLHEVKLAEPSARAMGDRLFGIRFNTGGLGKLHFLCATPNLDRFSIDHL